MKSLYKALCLAGLVSLPTSIIAKQNSDIDKSFNSTRYDFVNDLNKVLKSGLRHGNKPGIKQISTIQKDNQIIILIIHDPLLGYSNMVQNMAASASRINGVNFQNSFTLDIINSYCSTGLFYTILSSGLNSYVIVQYEDLRGNNVAQHRINKQLCKS